MTRLDGLRTQDRCMNVASPSGTVMFSSSEILQWNHKLRTSATVQFSGAFAKVLKATISFVMYVCPSVLTEHLGSHWKHFYEI